MSAKTIKLVYLIYGILLSVLLVVSGILLMISCYNIYQLGERPFTPESISDAFGKIQAVIYLSLGAVAIGAILKVFLPLDEPKIKAKLSPAVTLKRLEDKYDLSLCEADDIVTYNKAKKQRLIFKIAAASLSTVSLLPALIVAILPSSYTMEYNQSVVSLCYLIIPSFIVCALISSIYVYLDLALTKKQISALKALISDSKLQKSEKSECSACKQRKEHYHIKYGRIIVAVIAVAFIILGIFNGGMDDVLSKAINICTECIGLG